MNFIKGQRVQTPLGPGDVIYQRMAPPDFIEPEAVSVGLDNRQDNPFYRGTVFLASKVTPLAKD